MEVFERILFGGRGLGRGLFWSGLSLFGGGGLPFPFGAWGGVALLGALPGIIGDVPSASFKKQTRRRRNNFMNVPSAGGTARDRGVG